MKQKTLKGTKTLANLEEAFAGESMARNKYNWFAAQARKEGYNQIADFFDETARNEKEHAKLWFKLICDGSIPVLEKCLKMAADGEHFEHTQMYKRMAAEARKEGFPEIAKQFELVASVEQVHEKRYLALLNNIKKHKVFKKSKKVAWKCDNCGRIVYSTTAPEICDTCKHPQSYQQVNCNCTYDENGCVCCSKK